MKEMAKRCLGEEEMREEREERKEQTQEESGDMSCVSVGGRHRVLLFLLSDSSPLSCSLHHKQRKCDTHLQV